MRCLPGIMVEASDQFKRFPILKWMCTDVHRSVCMVVEPRRPMPGCVTVAIILYLWNLYLQLWTSQTRRARTALRNVIIWAYDFFGILRIAKLIVNAERTMGLLIPHVSLVRGGSSAALYSVHEECHLRGGPHYFHGMDHVFWGSPWGDDRDVLVCVAWGWGGLEIAFFRSYGS